MMTKPCSFAVAVLVALPLVTQAQSNPKFGTWKLNPAKSKLNGPPPRSDTRVYEDRGSGVFHSTRTGVDARGEPFLSQYAAKVDGKEYPRLVKGSGAMSSIAFTMIDARSVAWTVKIDGEVAMTGTSVVSEDERMLTTTVRRADARGQRIETVSVYDKQ